MNKIEVFYVEYLNVHIFFSNTFWIIELNNQEGFFSLFYSKFLRMPALFKRIAITTLQSVFCVQGCGQCMHVYLLSHIFHDLK